MEACAGAHHWGREIGRLGHEVRLLPPIYVKPFVKRHKNDTADAEARRPCPDRSQPVDATLSTTSSLHDQIFTLEAITETALHETRCVIRNHHHRPMKFKFTARHLIERRVAETVSLINIQLSVLRE